MQARDESDGPRRARKELRAREPRPEATPERAAMSEPSRAAFDWRALLLRYLPEPHGAAHSAKRFGAR
ncbi:hypothetical protein AcidC75_24780 [Acidisoma sp. C75]